MGLYDVDVVVFVWTDSECCSYASYVTEGFGCVEVCESETYAEDVVVAAVLSIVVD